MSSTDTVSSITNCYHLIVSYTDPVHRFIISERTVEPTGSSLYPPFNKIGNIAEYLYYPTPGKVDI